MRRKHSNLYFATMVCSLLWVSQALAQGTTAVSPAATDTTVTADPTQIFPTQVGGGNLRDERDGLHKDLKDIKDKYEQDRQAIFNNQDMPEGVKKEKLNRLHEREREALKEADTHFAQNQKRQEFKERRDKDQADHNGRVHRREEEHHQKKMDRKIQHQNEFRHKHGNKEGKGAARFHERHPNAGKRK